MLHRLHNTIRLSSLIRAAGLAGVLASAAALALPGAAVAKHHPRALTPQQTTYLNLATQGVGQTSAWWNKKAGWYNALLTNNAAHPLASIWDSVPLFETLDEIATASPTSAHIAAVKSFANFAEKYWNPDLKPGPGFGPYPGDRTANQETWFDDNGWWGVAFMDAYHATNTKAYLYQAENAFHFIQTEGWDTKAGGMWWTTTHAQGCGTKGNECPPWHSGEALGADTELAARLYQATRDPYYLDWAETMIAWANANILNAQGYYSLKDPGDAGLGATLQANGQMPHDGEGAMVAALVTLCQADPVDAFWCTDAEHLGTQEIKYLPNATRDPSSDALNDGPQYDAILLRGMLSLYSYEQATATGNARAIYTFVTDNASRIIASPANSGRYPDAWNGSASIPGWPTDTTGQLQTQAANINVFAALSTVAPPS